MAAFAKAKQHSKWAKCAFSKLRSSWDALMPRLTPPFDVLDFHFLRYSWLRKMYDHGAIKIQNSRHKKTFFPLLDQCLLQVCSCFSVPAPGPNQSKLTNTGKHHHMKSTNPYEVTWNPFSSTFKNSHPLPSISLRCLEASAASCFNDDWSPQNEAKVSSCSFLRESTHLEDGTAHTFCFSSHTITQESSQAHLEALC